MYSWMSQRMSLSSSSHNFLRYQGLGGMGTVDHLLLIENYEVNIYE